MPMLSAWKTVKKPYYGATLYMAKNSLHEGFALDIGCGENPYVFHKNINNYIGMDIDSTILKKISSSLHQANLICASGFYAPFRDGIFDLIICTEVLEHLENPEKIISEIGRVLTKGGTAVISIPSLSLPQMIVLWIAHKTKNISERPYQSPDHVREYAKFKVTPHFEKTSNLFKLFKQQGLEVKDAVAVQSLYAKQNMIWNILLSKIEMYFEKILSKHLIGHYTIFRAERQ